MARHATAAACLAAGLLLLTGCAQQMANAPAPVDYDAQIQKVKNDPNLPPQAKNIQLQMLEKQKAAAARGSRP